MHKIVPCRQHNDSGIAALATILDLTYEIALLAVFQDAANHPKAKSVTRLTWNATPRNLRYALWRLGCNVPPRLHKAAPIDSLRHPALIQIELVGTTEFGWVGYDPKHPGIIYDPTLDMPQPLAAFSAYQIGYLPVERRQG